MVRKELVKVYNDTVRIVEGMETKSNSLLFTYNFLPMSIPMDKFDKSIISVEPTDTITTAINLDGQGRTCILNMASNRKPGGGVKAGAMAQEECLFRCTDLFKTVTEDFYPLDIDKGLYTTDVMIVKDVYYNLLQEPVYVDCLTVPAINLNKFDMSEEIYKDVTRYKINMMLNLAASYKCDNLVLGAWGCGVYKNDPDFISKLFLKEINLRGYKFKKIVFGVINDHNSVDNNYEIFKKNLINVI